MTVALFGIVVLMTHFVESITGFGSTALALPFCVMLVGVKTAVPVLAVLRLMLSSCIVIVAFRDIVWESYLKIIAFAGLGLPVGMLILNFLPQDILMKILGVFMILVAARGIFYSFNEGPKVGREGGAQWDAFPGGCDPWGVQCGRAVGCSICSTGFEEQEQLQSDTFCAMDDAEHRTGHKNSLQRNADGGCGGILRLVCAFSSGRNAAWELGSQKDR